MPDPLVGRSAPPSPVMVQAPAMHNAAKGTGGGGNPCGQAMCCCGHNSAKRAPDSTRLDTLSKQLQPSFTPSRQLPQALQVLDQRSLNESSAQRQQSSSPSQNPAQAQQNEFAKQQFVRTQQHESAKSSTPTSGNESAKQSARTQQHESAKLATKTSENESPKQSAQAKQNELTNKLLAQTQMNVLLSQQKLSELLQTLAGQSLVNDSYKGALNKANFSSPLINPTVLVKAGYQENLASSLQQKTTLLKNAMEVFNATTQKIKDSLLNTPALLRELNPAILSGMLVQMPQIIIQFWKTAFRSLDSSEECTEEESTEDKRNSKNKSSKKSLQRVQKPDHASG